MKFSIVSFLCFIIFSCDAFPVVKKNSNQNALLDSIKTGNLEHFQEIIKDFDINAVFENGRNILHYIAEYGDEKILNVLIQNGDLNLKTTDSENLTPIHLAALNPNFMVLNTLMKLGGDKMINVEDNFKNTPLHLGALNENEKIAQLLLAHGADVKKLNSEQESVLHWSSINGNENVTNLLIKNGVTIDQKNNDNETSLHFAALNSNARVDTIDFLKIIHSDFLGNEKVAELLIKAGANVNAMANNSWTPIFYAIVNGNKKISEMLIKASNGNYAKKRAQEVLLKHFIRPIQKHANRKMVELLMSYGADVNHSLNDGRTPFDVAIAIDDAKIIELLF